MTLKIASLVTLGPEVMVFQQLAWAECTLCLEASPDSQISLTPSPQGPSISYGTPYMCIRIISLILTICWVNSSARDGREPAGVEQ